MAAFRILWQYDPMIDLSKKSNGVLGKMVRIADMAPAKTKEARIAQLESLSEIELKKVQAAYDNEVVETRPDLEQTQAIKAATPESLSDATDDDEGPAGVLNALDLEQQAREGKKTIVTMVSSYMVTESWRGMVRGSFVSWGKGKVLMSSQYDIPGIQAMGVKLRPIQGVKNWTDDAGVTHTEVIPVSEAENG